MGPDLAGVIGRRDSAWLTSFISDPEKMRSQGDPIAIALTAKYPNVRMPALGIAKADAADLTFLCCSSRDGTGQALEPPGVLVRADLP